jgi:hypothetical protein
MKRFVLWLAAASTLLAAEGKWTPEQVLHLDPAWLKQQGLELAPSRLWDPQRKTGLLAGAINLGGCSASFISPNGLIVTNHHCLFSILQEHATPENDIITNGFLARSHSEELPSKTTRVTVPRNFTDVTKEVLAAVPAGADDLARNKAIETKQKELVAQCERKKSTRCQVAVFDGGVQYVLIETFEISDIRLVYAPPRAIGEYGGEDDNFMWPRQAGDFTIARAYVASDGQSAAYNQANVPYKPEFYFPISTKGVAPGDFVMVMGYPVRSYRSLVAEEMAERRDLFFTRGSQLFGEWIKILEDTTKDNPEGTVAVAAMLKGWNNKYKNYNAQLAGFRRGRIIEKQREDERKVVDWAKGRPQYADALTARAGLIELVDQQRHTWEHDFLLRQLASGPKALNFAVQIASLASEKRKPDMERDPEYMDRNLPRLRASLERDQKAYFAPADKALFASLVRRVASLPGGQRIAVVERVFSSASGDAVQTQVDRLYSETRLLDLAERLKMIDENVEALHARHDPLLELAFALYDEEQALKKKEDLWEGRAARLRPLWRAAVMAHAGTPIAPDANGTLRVSFAHVKGYAPRDGVFYTPQTTLSGLIAKHTGQEPFNVPEAIRKAAEQQRYGRWQDPRLHDVPVDFLADPDTSGGNSGSPTINGRGELVGLNFDRVWENVSGDFGYNPEVARNVNVDVRFVLWMLDQIAGADELLREMGVEPGVHLWN